MDDHHKAPPIARLSPTAAVSSAHVPAALATELRLRVDTWYSALARTTQPCAHAGALGLAGPDTEPERTELVRRAEMLDALHLALDGRAGLQADQVRDEIVSMGCPDDVPHLRVQWLLQRSTPLGWTTMSRHRSIAGAHDAEEPGHVYRLAAELVTDD